MLNIKKLLPYIVAIISFFAISATYFAPQYEGKDIRKGDDIQAKAMSGGMEQFTQTYGEESQWAPNMFSGMPAYLIKMDFEGRIIKDISDYFYFMGKPAAYYFLLMIGFWAMLLCFGINPYLAIIGAVAYGLSTYFVIIYEAGHITKLMALAYIAPLIGAIYYSYKKNIWIGASLAAFFAAIEISCSHPQITYYFLFVITALVVLEGINHYKNNLVTTFWKKSGVLFIAAMLAVGANVVQLWYVNDYAKDSIRGASELTNATDTNAENHTSGLDKDYITAWSYGKMESFNLFIPNLMGGASSGGFSRDGEVAKSLKKYNAQSAAVQLPAYWGPQPFTSGAVYIGAAIIFLAVLALFFLDGWIKWWLVGATIFALILAWGKNLMWLTDLFIDYVPMYNKFRTVSMILVIAEWSLPFLALLGLQKLLDKKIEKERFLHGLKWSVIICGGIALLFFLVGGSILDFTSAQDGAMGLPEDVISAMQSERIELMKSDSIRSLLLVLASATVIFFWYNEKIKRNFAILLITAIVLIDMVGVNLRFLNYDDFVAKKAATEITPTAADLEILKDKDPNYRVANLAASTFNEAYTSYFHKSIGGYHAAKLRRYQDVIDRHLSQNHIGVFNMLNTKYFIVPTEGGAPQVMLNDEAFGNSWFVKDIKFVDNADQEIEALDSTSLRDVAVVDSKFKEKVGNVSQDSTAIIELTDYKINHLKYKSSSKEDGVAIFSEIYYPKGWQAYIDSKEVDHFRANYILRALQIPKGEHTIEFKFKAPNYDMFKTISALSSLLILAMLAFGIYNNYKKKKGGKK